MRAIGKAIGLIAAVLAAAPASSGAAPYDGSAPMQSAIKTVLVCDDGTAACVQGTAQTVNLPSVVKVDVGQRLISGAATGRTAQITSVSHAGGRLMLYGAETGIGGIGWNVVITEDSGRMAGAVVGPIGGFLIFGACSGAKARDAGGFRPRVCTLFGA